MEEKTKKKITSILKFSLVLLLFPIIALIIFVKCIFIGIECFFCISIVCNAFEAKETTTRSWQNFVFFGTLLVVYGELSEIIEERISEIKEAFQTEEDIQFNKFVKIAKDYLNKIIDISEELKFSKIKDIKNEDEKKTVIITLSKLYNVLAKKEYSNDFPNIIKFFKEGCDIELDNGERMFKGVNCMTQEVFRSLMIDCIVEKIGGRFPESNAKDLGFDGKKLKKELKDLSNWNYDSSQCLNGKLNR